jgi:SNF2 family DNA or RNA helicase
VITGTPIENKLLDLYSIVQFLDIYFLAPQWEFSYQHCIFDSKQKNKIHGYYNLVNLKQRLNQILIRREKKMSLSNYRMSFNKIFLLNYQMSKPVIMWVLRKAFK